MASQTSSVSGSVTTYTITDMENSTITVAVTQNPTVGVTATFTSSGAVHGDAMSMLAQLMLLVATGIVP
jgi:hypothetical protein